MNIKLLTKHYLEFLSLHGGCIESTLVKIPHCWKSHVTAHIYLMFFSGHSLGLHYQISNMWDHHNQPCAAENTPTRVAGFQKNTEELSGRGLDSRLRGRGFEPHWHHCVVVLEQDAFILA